MTTVETRQLCKRIREGYYIHRVYYRSADGLRVLADSTQFNSGDLTFARLSAPYWFQYFKILRERESIMSDCKNQKTYLTLASGR